MSTDVIADLEAALGRADLLGGNLLVGVSGGLDSVCLFRLLRSLSGKYGGRLEVAHVDHGLRVDSAQDAVFCQRLAEQHGAPFHLRRLPAGELAGPDGLQAEARAARRGFFEAVLQGRGLSAVVLGHHADDQVETVLYRLLRGAGLRGAGGMEEYSPPYLRPLLGIRRAVLENLAATRGWEFRDDATNRELRYARNRLRLEALPALRRVHPGADAGVLRFARLAAEDDRVLSRLAREFVARTLTTEPEGLCLGVAHLAALEPSLRWRIYLALWDQLGLPAGVLQLRHLESVDALLQPGRAHREAPVPGPGHFVVSYGQLWLLRPGIGAECSFSGQLQGVGAAPVRCLAGVLCWSEALPPGCSGVAVPAGVVGAVRTRSPRPGERVVVPGRRSRKLKDLLIAARMPRWRRPLVAVLEHGATVFGALGPGFSCGGDTPAGGWIWLDEGGCPRAEAGG